MNVKTYVRSIIFQDENGKEIIVKQGETELIIITINGILCEGIVKSIYVDSLILFNSGASDCIYFENIKYISLKDLKK